MKYKIRIFWESVHLVMRSAPVWTASNIILSLISSFLPLALLWYIKKLIDSVTIAAAEVNAENTRMVLLMILAIAIIYFLDEATQ
ncbi:MAG TPA: hypothetical protein DEQ09_08985 [Bacteroidales bacterium]|nr:hypothetical protein [Bacteroidales bacterium]